MMNNPEKHILLLGGCGYIGSVLTGRLLQRGYRVRVLDRLIYGNGDTVADWIERPGFSLVVGDFCDRSCLEGALDGITDVILLAALVGDPICKKYPDEARRINQEGARQAFDMAGEHPGIQRFVFFSTCSNYGLHSGLEPADETAALNPLSLYAETKVATERHLLDHASETGVSPVVLRLATAYGLSRRMRFDLTVSEFTRELASGRELLVYDEKTWRPYCHVQDIADAAMRVLETEPALIRGEVFNVGGNDENYTKQKIVDIIQKKVPDARVHYNSGGSDPRDYRVSFDKIESRLSFRPEYTVETGVVNLLHALRAGLFADVDVREKFYGNYVIENG